MSVVPVIDISALHGEDDDAKAAVAAELDSACREIGFFQIRNHGIPAEVIDAMYQTSNEFFSLPDTEKRRVAQPSPDTVRGYSSIGEQAFSYSETCTNRVICTRNSMSARLISTPPIRISPRRTPDRTSCRTSGRRRRRRWNRPGPRTSGR